MASIREHDLKGHYLATKANNLNPIKLLHGIRSLLRRLLFQVLAVGPLPVHVAFIPDGNRRYEKKRRHVEGEGHRLGFLSIMVILHYCYEIGVKYVSVYGFSIDNFKRKPSEVQIVMDLIKENLDQIVRDMRTIDEFGVRLVFLGNLDLLEEPIREMAKKATDATARNTKMVLTVCLAYTATDEIVHGVRGALGEATVGGDGTSDDVVVSAGDIEKHMYFSGYPDPDIVIRSSGETRLSNFMLWQSSAALLHATRCLWPEISLRHMVWAVLDYQRNFAYLEKIKKDRIGRGIWV